MFGASSHLLVSLLFSLLQTTYSGSTVRICACPGFPLTLEFLQFRHWKISGKWEPWLYCSYYCTNLYCSRISKFCDPPPPPRSSDLSLFFFFFFFDNLANFCCLSFSLLSPRKQSFSFLSNIPLTEHVFAKLQGQDQFLFAPNNYLKIRSSCSCFYAPPLDWQICFPMFLESAQFSGRSFRRKCRFKQMDPSCVICREHEVFSFYLSSIFCELYNFSCFCTGNILSSLSFVISCRCCLL